MSSFLTSKPVTELLFGATHGIVIGLIALSLVLIWRSTRVLNFAQGGMAMLATYVGFGLLVYNVGYWWCVVVSIAAGMVLGGLVEFTLVRRLYGKPEINPIVVMVGLLLTIEAVVAAIWSPELRQIPTPFSQDFWQISGQTFGLSPMAIFVIGVSTLALAFVGVLFKFTKLGLQLRASALAPEVSRLLGVRVGRMLTLGWVLSTGVGALAAVLIATSQSEITPSYMDGLFVLGFVAAAIGGLESSVGAVAAGVALGIMSDYISAYSSQNLTSIMILVLLIVVLTIRPHGLFTKSVARRV